MKEIKKRNCGIDLIKIVACIGVVLLHSIGLKSSKYNNLIYYIGTISIPLFFMANGYFVLNKEKIDLKYRLKKIIKYAGIIILWNIIYWGIYFLVKNNTNNLLIQIIKSILGKGKVYWLWFLGSLIMLYAICPVLKKILDNKKINKKFLIILICLCEIIYIINLVRGYNGENIIRKIIPQSFRIWTWIFYFYLGGYLNKNNIFLERYVKLYGLFLLTGVCIIYEFVIARYILKDLYAENFYDNIWIIFWTVSLFLYMKNLNIKEKYKKKITEISSNTMGIYLIHEFILMLINKFYSMNNSFMNILIFIGLLFISYILVYILKKVPHLNKIIS